MKSPLCHNLASGTYKLGTSKKQLKHCVCSAFFRADRSSELIGIQTGFRIPFSQNIRCCTNNVLYATTPCPTALDRKEKWHLAKVI
mmetsp:Transcript_4352/g.12169  ORF Transcript_4352/g.12169 Transcript_4352/m.12169 type:complete len:86 (-) Transcript_4352:1192-1449(-)